MRSETKLSVFPKKTSFLIILLGVLEYDGRAKRMIAVLKDIGSISLVDLKKKEKNTFNAHDGVERIDGQFPLLKGKLGQHLSLWLTTVWQALRLKPDVVVAENYFTCFPTWIAAKLSGAKMLYDAYELITPESNGKMTLRNYFWYLLERWTVTRSDLVIAANGERSQLMADHYGLKHIPVTMRNIPFKTSISPNQNKEIRTAPAFVRKSREERIILYQGWVSLSRGLDRFVEALAFLPRCYRFVVAGGGPDLDKLCKMARPCMREGRFFSLGQIENRLMPYVAPLADVGIVCYPFQGQNNIYCAPNKLFEYAQAGLPVVATDQPPLRKAVETFNIGALIGRESSADHIAKVLQKVASDKDQYQRRIEIFLAANRWEDEAGRVRKSVLNTLSTAA